jgi:gamma-glutamylcyclotransferase (GGCT)/AIG2-like uncharacterized protein YtfP
MFAVRIRHLAAWPDRVRGLLYDLGPYPAAMQIGRVEQEFGGWVLEISQEELERLDEYEGIAGGLYRRIRTVTMAGRVVWVYEYSGELPEQGRGPLDRWPA